MDPSRGLGAAQVWGITCCALRSTFEMSAKANPHEALVSKASSFILCSSEDDACRIVAIPGFLVQHAASVVRVMLLGDM